MVRVLIYILIAISIYAGHFEKDWWNYLIWIQVWSCVAMYCITYQSKGYTSILSGTLTLMLFIKLLDVLSQNSIYLLIGDIIIDIIAIIYLIRAKIKTK